MTAPGHVVLVIGPPLAGVGAVVEALRDQLPGATVVEADQLGLGCAPDAVIAVVSAVAPLTRSDWAPIERAMTRTDLVIGVVTKIDAHRGWREVMVTDRELVATWDARHESMPWLGVAAAPDLGEARLGPLVDMLTECLADPDLETRNQRRIRASHRPVQRPARAVHASVRADTAELRRVLQRTRLLLLRFVRQRCSELRAELRDEASTVAIGGSAGFENLVRAETARFHVEVIEEINRGVDAASAELAMHDVAALEPVRNQDPPDVSRTPSSSRRLEGRLMTVLGVGFGLGIALASSRFLAGLAPGSTAAGSVVGASAGLALVVWVVRTRGLLHDRALLDRWVVEVGATLRWHGEAMVAERLLVVESQWAASQSRSASRPTSGEELEKASVDLKLTYADITDQYEWC